MNWNGIISLLLACIELVLLVNILIFAEKNNTNIMISFLVALLAVYQILEFIMCNLNLKYSYMAYAAFVDISFLPPLNLLFNFRYFDYNKKILRLIFIPSFFFIIYYPFIIENFAVINCTAFYASYYYPLGTLFGFFYYLPIIISIAFLFYKKKELQEVKKVKMINALLFGEIFISIPVIAAFIIALFKSYGPLNIIESIMCKFAFVFAICLVYFALNNKKVLNE